eukprot:TRINITY_DN52_c0_g3_i3.p1 TRINITY_DN52_c0_g3~~TRINITY_DN52_c0_g3_i3.p1  ORF type:complete len:694 (+),score=352.59 TRINITY_DN52_c0_g3_i3:89-2170(+)
MRTAAAALSLAALGNPAPMTFQDMSEAWSEVTSTRGILSQAHAAQMAAYHAWAQFAQTAHQAQGALPVFAGAYAGLPAGPDAAGPASKVSEAAALHESWTAAHSAAILQQNGLMLRHLAKLKENLLATHRIAEEIPLDAQQLHEQTLAQLQASALSVQSCTAAVHAAALAVSSAHVNMAAAGEKLRYASTNGGADQREIALAQTDAQMQALILDNSSKNYFVNVVGCRGAYEEYGTVANEFKELSEDMAEDAKHPAPPPAGPADGPADAAHHGPADTALLGASSKLTPAGDDDAAEGAEINKAIADAESVETDSPAGPHDPHMPINDFIHSLNTYGSQQLAAVAAVAANKAWAEFVGAASEAQKQMADAPHGGHGGDEPTPTAAWTPEAQHAASLHEAFLMAHSSAVMQSNGLQLGVISALKAKSFHDGSMAEAVVFTPNQLLQQVQSKLAATGNQLASCSSQVHANAMGVAAAHVQYVAACTRVAYAHDKDAKVQGLAKIDADMAYLSFDNAQKGYFLAFVGCKGAYKEYQHVMQEYAKISHEVEAVPAEQRDTLHRPASGAIIESEAEKEAEGEGHEEGGHHEGGHHEDDGHSHRDNEEIALEADDTEMLNKEEASLSRQMRRRRNDGLNDEDAAFASEIAPEIEAVAAAHGHTLKPDFAAAAPAKAPVAPAKAPAAPAKVPAAPAKPAAH